MIALPPITKSDFEAFKRNPCWLFLCREAEIQLMEAQNVRDDEDCSRDKERMHLGIVRTCRNVISLPERLEREFSQQLKKKEENNV
jgi:hypothetical protein